MGELLKNMLSLREEIDKLTELGDEMAYEWCHLAIKIADTTEQIENMKVEKENLDENIADFKLKKGILYASPIGVFFSILFFTCLVISCLDKLTIGTILFTIIGTPASSMAISFMISSFLIHSNKFNNFLITKYAHLKEMNKQLNNLIFKIRISENNIIDMKKREEEISNIIMNDDDVIEAKIEELHKLEQEYFNNIRNNPVTKVTTYDISPAGKKRTLTRGNDYR